MPKNRFSLQNRAKRAGVSVQDRVALGLEEFPKDISPTKPSRKIRKNAKRQEKARLNRLRKNQSGG